MVENIDLVYLKSLFLLKDFKAYILILVFHLELTLLGALKVVSFLSAEIILFTFWRCKDYGIFIFQIFSYEVTEEIF